MANATLRPPRVQPKASRLDVSLWPDRQEVPAGGRVRFRLRIENPEPEAQRVILRFEPSDPEWRAFLPLRLALVPPKSATTLFLRVDAPADASPGVRHNFVVEAASAHRPDQWVQLEAEAVLLPA